MRILLIVVAVAAVVWGGLWFVGARAMEQGVTSWFEAQSAEGQTAVYATLETAGFPNRLDTTVTELELADPQSGAAVTADRLSVYALVYRPNHVIAKAADIAAEAPGSLVSATAAELSASAVVAANADLTLDRLTAILTDVDVSALGPVARMPELRAAIRPAAARSTAYEIGVEAIDLRPSDSLRSALSLSDEWPETLNVFHIDMILGLDAPLDRHSGDTPPTLTDLDFRKTQLRWGEAGIELSGRVDLDAGGLPEGRVDITLRGWRDLLALAEAAEALPPAALTTASRTLNLLSQIGSDPDTIEAPLSFQNGFMSFGPIPLGPAPRLR